MNTQGDNLDSKFRICLESSQTLDQKNELSNAGINERNPSESTCLVTKLHLD